MIHRPDIAEKVLSLLRQFGWDKGLRRLSEEIVLIDDREHRDDLRFFDVWIAAERGNYAEALELFLEAEDYPEEIERAALGRGIEAIRKHDDAEAECLLG